MHLARSVPTMPYRLILSNPGMKGPILAICIALVRMAGRESPAIIFLNLVTVQVVLFVTMVDNVFLACKIVSVIHNSFVIAVMLLVFMDKSMLESTVKHPFKIFVMKMIQVTFVSMEGIAIPIIRKFNITIKV